MCLTPFQPLLKERCLWRCFSISQILCLVGYQDEMEPTWALPRVLPPPGLLSCSILATACGNAHWQSPSYSSLSFCLLLHSGGTKLSPCTWHLSMSASWLCWKRARRQQSRKKPCFPTGCRNLCLAEGQQFPHRFLFFFLLPCHCGSVVTGEYMCLSAPATHPKPWLSQSLSPGHICTFELIFCLFYKVFCSLSCHVSNHTCLLYFTSPDDSWLSWREVAVPNHVALRWVAQILSRSCVLDPIITDPITPSLQQCV